jgi:hypothetical protein
MRRDYTVCPAIPSQIVLGISSMDHGQIGKPADERPDRVAAIREICFSLDVLASFLPQRCG